MTKKQYENIFLYFEQHPCLKKLLIVVSKGLPFLTVVVYAAMLILLWIQQKDKFVLFLVIPAGVFLVVTALRKMVHRTRPYDALGFDPLIHCRPHKGQSFPSRHTASAFIIAYACLYYSPLVGGIMMVIALMIAVSRVLTGMHYPSDVISGWLISSLAALIYLCKMF